MVELRSHSFRTQKSRAFCFKPKCVAATSSADESASAQSTSQPISTSGCDSRAKHTSYSVVPTTYLLPPWLAHCKVVRCLVAGYSVTFEALLWAKLGSESPLLLFRNMLDTKALCLYPHESAPQRCRPFTPHSSHHAVILDIFMMYFRADTWCWSVWVLLIFSSLHLPPEAIIALVKHMQF